MKLKETLKKTIWENACSIHRSWFTNERNLTNNFTTSWQNWERNTQTKSNMVISAHWLTDGTHVTCIKKPATIMISMDSG